MVEKVNFSSIDVIMALLVFLPRRFPNDPEKTHSTIARLRDEEEYKDLLEEFEFIDYRFPYSSLLGRILVILRGGMELLSPDCDEYIVNDAFVEAIRKEVLPKFSRQQQDKLKEIALEFKSALGC